MTSDFREYYGVKKSQAINEAEEWSKKTGRESIAFFQKRDEDGVSWYDWCSHRDYTSGSCQYVRESNVVWSSVDGHYSN